MLVKASISLSEQQYDFARGLVKKGEYASVSAVVQRGLELLRSETEREAAEMAALKAFFQSRADGAFVSTNEGRKQTASMLEQKRRETGL